MSSLCTMKSNQNGEISANEKDNRNSQKHNDVASRKRDEPEDESERKNEHSNTNNKKLRVFCSPEPELGHVLELESPASFNTLDDDCLGNVLDFVGKKCYSVFGRVNKRCHEMFCSKGYPKVTHLYGYGSLDLIQQKEGWYYNHGFSKGVIHYNRIDVFEWLLTDESDDGYERLNYLCIVAIEESRLDILREVFDRANERQLERLRDCNSGFDLCLEAADYGKLECMKCLRENECEWDEDTWYEAKIQGHENILEYLRNNGYPTEWQY